jgi:hypothetical protein
MPQPIGAEYGFPSLATPKPVSWPPANFNGFVCANVWLLTAPYGSYSLVFAGAAGFVHRRDGRAEGVAHPHGEDDEADRGAGDVRRFRHAVDEAARSCECDGSSAEEERSIQVDLRRRSNGASSSSSASLDFALSSSPPPLRRPAR